MIKKTATLSEVAKAAGVSAAAVAKVMYNSKGNTRVGKEKAELIRRISAEMNLAPNTAARALRTGKTRMIGFLSGGSAGEIRIRTMTELTKILEEKNYQIIFRPSHRYETLHDFAGSLAASCDAVVVDATFVKGTFPAVCADKLLILTSDEQADNCGHPVIRYDHSFGVKEALQHLTQLGHKKILMLSINWWNNRDNARVRAFQKYSKEFGLQYAPIEYLAETFDDVTIDQISGLLKKHSEATAVFCVCDTLALRVLQAAHQLGINVPKALSVMGFDDISSSALSIPALTTVRQPNREVAQSAVNYLMNKLENTRYEVDYAPKCRLIKRDSTDIPKQN